MAGAAGENLGRSSEFHLVSTQFTLHSKQGTSNACPGLATLGTAGNLENFYPFHSNFKKYILPTF